MANLPDELQEEFSNYGDSFFNLAEIMYANHGKQYTQGELTDKLDVTQPRVSDFTEVLENENWINRNNGETTFVWNTEKYNPAEMEVTEAVTGLYIDLWRVFKKHALTSTGVVSIFGFALFMAASVLGTFYIAFVLGVFQESAVPVSIYAFLALMLSFVGVMITMAVPVLALANRLANRFWPSNSVFDEE